MSRPPWAADRSLDAAGVRSAVVSQFPEHAAESFRRVGSGWDYDVWESDGGWLWRFPRRRAVADDQDRVVRSAELGARAMAAAGLQTPRFERFGREGPHFPYPFLGYRSVRGVGADTIPLERALDAGLVESLAAALHALHRIDVADAARLASARRGLEGEGERLERLVSRASEIAPAVPDEYRAVCAPWLAGDIALPPRFVGPARIVHNDLCPDHLIVDPVSGRLVGVIDFDDLSLGDPALDFVATSGWLGRHLASLVVAVGGDQAPGFRERLAFLVRVMALTWLGDGVEMGQDVEKHQRWVRNVFRMVDSIG